MLADVDCVLMGAGIPREIPGVLDAFADNRPASIRFEVDEPAGFDCEYLELDPAELFDGPLPELRRPRFLAIVASNSLATMLLRKSTGRVDGFIIEAPSAGWLRAIPRAARSAALGSWPSSGTAAWKPRPFASACPITCTATPASASGEPNPIPIAITPMCSRLE